jgi:hypothetical protein
MFAPHAWKIRSPRSPNGTGKARRGGAAVRGGAAGGRRQLRRGRPRSGAPGPDRPRFADPAERRNSGTEPAPAVSCSPAAGRIRRRLLGWVVAALAVLVAGGGAGAWWAGRSLRADLNTARRDTAQLEADLRAGREGIDVATDALAAIRPQLVATQNALREGTRRANSLTARTAVVEAATGTLTAADEQLQAQLINILGAVDAIAAERPGRTVREYRRDEPG